MPIRTLFFLSLLFFCSCQFFEKDPNAANLVETSAQSDARYDTKSKDILKTGGIIVGKKVKVFENPDFKAKIKGNLETGKVISVNKIGKKRIPIEEDPAWCDEHWGYPWVEIDTGDGLTGWVYGKYIYKILDNKLIEDFDSPLSQLNIPFDFYGQGYYLGLAVDLSYPIKNGVGFTGCEDFYFPFFYQDEPTQIWPIYYDTKPVNDAGQVPLSHLPEGNIWIMIESENVFELIEEILDVTRNSIVFKLKQEYNEGLASSNVEVRFNREKFKASVKNYKVTLY